MTYGLNLDLVIEGGELPGEMIFTIDPPTLAFAPTVVSPELVGHGRHLLTIFTPLGTDPGALSDRDSAADELTGLYGRIKAIRELQKSADFFAIRGLMNCRNLSIF